MESGGLTCPPRGGINRDRVVVSFATGRYVKGQWRLIDRMGDLGEQVMAWTDEAIPGCPAHEERPYAFKAAALDYAAASGFKRLLWCDACIYPLGTLERIWDHAATYGAWISKNGWRNDQWTAEWAYEHLQVTPEQNGRFHHVIATAFAVDLTTAAGRWILSRYIDICLKTPALVGPWKNGPIEGPRSPKTVPRQAPCGDPALVLGHRHDQTVLSAVAGRWGLKLTDPPDFIAYGKVGTEQDPRTILLADGDY